MSIEVYETMSTATMWLLLFVVAALALLIAALTKTKFTVQKISIIGIMAAMSFVAYEFFRIPNVIGTGSSFHLGTTFTALTAMLLDGVSGGLAGAIGLALADILAGDPGYAVTTFVLKFIIGITCGAVAHKVFKLRDLDRHSKGYLLKVIVAGGSGLLLIVIIVGGVMSGIFTATESAAVAVAYPLFLSIDVYRSNKIKDLPKILLDACETTAVIMFLIAGSNVMSYIMSFTGLPSAIGNALISVSSNKYVILLIINLVLLVVGCFMDITPAVLIFTPIFLPVVPS